MGCLLGIDIGTSSAKVLLATEAGEVVARASAEYPITRPRTDWAEQDSEDWWRAVVAGLRKALKAAPQCASDIAGIGLSGQMHGTLLLDDQGAPLAPAVIWPDQRSARQVAEITSLVGRERLLELTGSPLATGFQAATIRWVQQHDPDVWRRARWVVLPKDYIRYRLAGAFATDPSDGSGTLLLDVRQRDWSDEVLDALEIDRRRLPPVQPSSCVAGSLSAEASEATGVPAGVPVVTGAADTACSLLGAGVLAPASLLLTISTGGQVVLPAVAVAIDRAGRAHTFCSALAPGDGRAAWYEMAATLAAGLSLRWLRDVLGLAGVEGAYDQMVAWATAAPLGAGGLLYLPYLLGERTPHMDPLASGMLLGLTASHTRAHLVRAVLEGVVMGCWDAYTVLVELGAAPVEIVMAGGGARSRLWQQIVADIFGLPVRPLLAADQSTLGALVLAADGVGLGGAAFAANAVAGRGAVVEPDAQHHAQYQELVALFRDQYAKHRDDFRALAALRSTGSPVSVAGE